jgi:hypothetical protein
VHGSERKKCIVLFRMKVLTKFVFALFTKYTSTCRFPLVFVRYYQVGIEFTEGRFCPRHKAQAASHRLPSAEASSLTYLQLTLPVSYSSSSLPVPRTTEFQISLPYAESIRRHSTEQNHLHCGKSLKPYHWNTLLILYFIGKLVY